MEGKTEGRITTINSALRSEYALKDHLGNTRLMFSDKNNDGVITQSSVQEPVAPKCSIKSVTL